MHVCVRAEAVWDGLLYVTDGVVRKRNDTLHWSREGQKHCLTDN